MSLNTFKTNMMLFISSVIIILHWRVVTRRRGVRWSFRPKKNTNFNLFAFDIWHIPYADVYSNNLVTSLIKRMVAYEKQIYTYRRRTDRSYRIQVYKSLYSLFLNDKIKINSGNHICCVHKKKCKSLYLWSEWISSADCNDDY